MALQVGLPFQTQLATTLYDSNAYNDEQYTSALGWLKGARLCVTQGKISHAIAAANRAREVIANYSMRALQNHIEKEANEILGQFPRPPLSERVSFPTLSQAKKLVNRPSQAPQAMKRCPGAPKRGRGTDHADTVVQTRELRYSDQPPDIKRQRLV